MFPNLDLTLDVNCVHVMEDPLTATQKMEHAEIVILVHKETFVKGVSLVFLNRTVQSVCQDILDSVIRVM